MTERITRQLLAAVDTMEAAVEDAKRRARAGDADAVRRVLHALTWGFANAQSSIQCAMESLQEDAEVAAIMARAPTDTEAAP